MKGKEFERLILARMESEEKQGRGTITRCGVQVSMVPNKPPATGVSPVAIKSLPDFEGLVDSGMISFDAKVCQESSFSLSAFRPGSKKGNKVRQLQHLFKRARFGATAFLLIHWPERILKTKSDPEQTWAFPVDERHEFWVGFHAEEIKSISRDDCEKYATRVTWNCGSRGRIDRPDVVNAVRRMRDSEIPIPEPDSELAEPPPF